VTSKLFKILDFFINFKITQNYYHLIAPCVSLLGILWHWHPRFDLSGL